MLTDQTIAVYGKDGTVIGNSGQSSGTGFLSILQRSEAVMQLEEF